MFFRQIYEKGLAHASYMVGCQKSGTVLVIDPKRDVDTYIDIAKQEKLIITQIIETHIHADFLSGSRELQELTGAELLLSNEGGAEWQYNFPHTPLHDGSVFMNGNIRFEVWHTPGHTPEHISFLVSDTPATNRPIMFFSGDFVFVGDVGRPDLLERAAGYKGTMEVGARQMFHSLARFKSLPDYIQVHPAHGAGSACGKALGDIPHSTVGYEKITNWALQFEDEDAFVNALLEGQPEPPAYFAMMKKLNKEVRPIHSSLIEVPELDSHELEALKQSGAQIVDTREKHVFCRAFIPGSVNIQNNNAFSTWAGWILNYNEPIVLLCTKHALEDVVRRCMRIGLDRIVGYCDDLHTWTDRGHSTDSIHWLSTQQLHDMMQKQAPHILDVRNHAEWTDGHFSMAQHIHAGYLTQHLSEINRDETVAIMCASGNRSTIACSLLKRAGFTNILNVEGGYDGWIAAGLEVP